MFKFTAWFQFFRYTENEIYPLGKNVYYLSGKVDIDEFNVLFQSNINKKNFETLAGFILFLAGKIPAQGEIFQYRNLSFTIMKANERKIDGIKLRILDQEREKID